MNKVDTKAVREKIVDMMGELRKIITLYISNNEKAAAIEESTAFSRVYKDEQLARLKETLKGEARTRLDSLQRNYEKLVEVLKANDSVYDFSDPEFTACVALLSATDQPLQMETISGIAKKFLGHRQVLLALAEVAKETNKVVLKKKVFNTEAEAEKLQQSIISLDIGFPESVISIPSIRAELIGIARACGEELTEKDTDLGTGYQDIMNSQIRVAMGLN
ncbi:MAG: hypothetical protein KHZ72_14500 [Lachnospiraceae bacterium]|nr:hypothetical protein [Lachnospiraceae bacterium]